MLLYKRTYYKIPMAEKVSKPQNSRVFIRGIAASALKNVYLFLGEEEHEKEKAAQLIAHKHTGSADARAFTGFHCDSESILSCARFVLEQSMFAGRKVAFLSGIEAATNKKDSSLIIEMTDNISDDTILIMTTSANQPPAFIKKSLPKIETVIFWRMFESELLKYIPEQFAAQGRRIDVPGSSKIVALCGRDLGKIDAAVKRIIDGTDEKTISAGTVIKLIADEREIKIFELIDNIFRKRKDALFQLKKILDEDVHELQILALLERELERIERYRHLVSGGSSPSEAARQAGVLPQNTEEFSGRAAKFSVHDIRTLFTFVHDADSRLKSGSTQSFLSNPLCDLVARIIV
jgi:DNA polymerase III subunit delta